MADPLKTNPAGNKASDPLQSVTWDLLLDTIERGECIVCIGPGIFTEKDGKTLEQRLSDHLRNQQNNLKIRVYDDGWYHFLDGKRQSLQTWYAIKKFYEQTNPIAEQICAQLAAIKFELIVSMTPDYKMRDAIHASRGENNYLFDAYVKNVEFTPLDLPTVDKPMVYNLLGQINITDSIVHTYEDMYQYLGSVFKAKSMAPKLRDKLESANHYLFIGLPFDRWYMHLFLHILKQNELQGRIKYAPSELVLSEIEEQYNITFVEVDPQKFVAELYQRCQDRGLIYKPADSQDDQPGPGNLAPALAMHPEISAMKALVAEAKIIPAIAALRQFIFTHLGNENTLAMDLLNGLILEEGTFYTITNAYNRADINQSEYELKLKNVRSKLLDYMDDAQRLFNQLNHP